MKVVDYHKEGKTLKHVWSNCIGAGRANEGLRADWQEQLKTVKDACGFHYLRFHGLLHDDMHVYKEENGEIVFNYQYVDKLFDRMLEMGIRPFVEFGFMPSDLASTEATQFWWKGRIAPPKDYDKWGSLIEGLVKHWIFRYGEEEVKNWYFEVWNEPNLPVFWDGTKSQYFELYRVAVQVIKNICKDFRVGGPATSNFVPDDRFDGEREDTSKHLTFQVEDINTLDWRGVWIQDFLTFCEKEELPIDFISTHPYPTDFALDGYGECRGLTRYRDALLDDITWLKNVIEKSAYPNVEIHLTEWSSSPSSRDYSHDYLPEAVNILYNNLQCTGIDSLSYWVFTDIFEELGAGPKPFHGGFGLLTLCGVKKPAYHAYRMLNQLGDIEVERGEGYLFSKRDSRMSAVFYHYPEAYKDSIPMSMYPDQQKALDCQNFEAEREFAYEVTGLQPQDRYTLRILRAEDIAVMKWNEMGAPTDLSREQEEILRKQGDVFAEQELLVNEEGVLYIDFKMAAWGVAEIN